MIFLISLSLWWSRASSSDLLSVVIGVNSLEYSDKAFRSVLTATPYFIDKAFHVFPDLLSCAACCTCAVDNLRFRAIIHLYY